MLIDVIKEETLKAVNEAVEKELERNGAEYVIGETDYGCINNGVGIVKLDPQPEYDTDRAIDNVLNNIAEAIRDNDRDEFLYKLMVENDKVRNAFAEWLESLQ